MKKLITYAMTGALLMGLADMTFAKHHHHRHHYHKSHATRHSEGFVGHTVKDTGQFAGHTVENTGKFVESIF
jgi:hypothetical protein